MSVQTAIILWTTSFFVSFVFLILFCKYINGYVLLKNIIRMLFVSLIPIVPAIVVVIYIIFFKVYYSKKYQTLQERPSRISPRYTYFGRLSRIQPKNSQIC